ncbi:MAG: hypothetical protein AAB903_02760 [Patescibacteria group bacterium]
MKNKNIIIAVGIVVLLAATIGYYTSRQINNPETEIRSLVTEFGTKLWMVSLAAPSSTVIQSIKDNYVPYISQGLLEGWEMAPERAPGKSSLETEPTGIEIFSIELTDDGAYEVQAKVVEASLSGGSTPLGYPLGLKLRNQGGKWVITGATKAIQN